MDKIIKNVLTTLEKNGYKAYLVGGFVRDYLLGIKSFDVDICTNALPKDLHKIFPHNTNSNSYGGFNLKIKKYNIDITTFRKELTYVGRKPTKIIYLNDLEEDIIRRDFTINCICMDKDENIIDLLKGIDDLNSKKIKMIGNIKERLVEDPLRILRAIRFSSVLDFEIDYELKKEIKNNYLLIKKLSKFRIKQELDKILLNKNFLKGLNLLKEFKILELLEINYEEITYVEDICGMWAQLSTNVDYAFTKQELTNIINIRKIIEGSNIDNKVLYKYGLYNSLVAGSILNIDKKIVNKIYDALPLKNVKDLQITNLEIKNILNVNDSKIIKNMKEELIELVLDKKIKNKNSELKKYILTRKEM